MAAWSHPTLTSHGPRLTTYRSRGFVYSQYVGRHALLADGNTSCLGYGIRSDAAAMLLNMEEGKGRVWRSVRGTYHPARQYEYGSWFRLLFFVGLFLTPFPWARRSWRAASNGRPQEPK